MVLYFLCVARSELLALSKLVVPSMLLRCARLSATNSYAAYLQWGTELDYLSFTIIYTAAELRQCPRACQGRLRDVLCACVLHACSM
jgi:hypothetical protein